MKYFNLGLIFLAVGIIIGKGIEEYNTKQKYNNLEQSYNRLMKVTADSQETADTAIKQTKRCQAILESVINPTIME